jgi:hypothetical protein
MDSKVMVKIVKILEISSATNMMKTIVIPAI